MRQGGPGTPAGAPVGLLGWRAHAATLLASVSLPNLSQPHAHPTGTPQTRASKEACPWYEGPTLFEALDSVEIAERPPTAPFRMPIVDKYKVWGLPGRERGLLTPL